MSNGSQSDDYHLDLDFDFIVESNRSPFHEAKDRFRIYFPEATWNEEVEIFTPTQYSVLFLGWLTAYVDRGVISEHERKAFLRRLAAYNKRRKK